MHKWISNALTLRDNSPTVPTMSSYTMIFFFHFENLSIFFSLSIFFIHSITYSPQDCRRAIGTETWVLTKRSIGDKVPFCQSRKPCTSIVVTTDLRLHKERTTLLRFPLKMVQEGWAKSTTMPPETAKCQSSGVWIDYYNVLEICGLS